MNNEERILDMFEIVIKRLDSLEAGQDELRVGQDGLRAGQDGMRAELDGLNARLTSLESKVDNGFSETNQRFDGVESRLERIESVHLKNLYHGQALIRGDINLLKIFSEAAFEEIERVFKIINAT